MLQRLRLVVNVIQNVSLAKELYKEAPPHVSHSSVETVSVQT